MRGLWEQGAPYAAAGLALYALTVALVLLITGWVMWGWLISAIAVWLVATVGYTAWKTQQRRRHWQQQQDRQVSE